ncbi:chromate transporter [Variovorax sp. PCZ-1]|uniref:chromate transporter n=1 Tax=Variovorax sp. PCZ-1 TaxID=2835533 RepID=UPI001BCB5CB8|nr:chromate transporter [Variovorax sp. PCZ-1]MBS7807681.1 chromate transporter [Variovorax sp. PCZ-1]
MTWEIWFSLFTHFILLSLLAVGGAITTAADMQRYVVEKEGWLTDMQFTSCIAIAQAAPGPNVLFIPLIGWQIGLQMGGSYWDAAAGLLATFIGIMVPSSTLTFAATRWLQNNAQHVVARASKASLAPISIALLLATAWLLASSHDSAAKDWPLWLFTISALLLAWKTKIHLLLILGTGAVLGMIGVI